MTRSNPSADPRPAGRALKQGAVLSVLTGVTMVGAAAYQFVVAALFGTGVGVDVYLGVLAVPTLLVGGATHVFNVSVLPEVVRAREQVHASGPPLPGAGEDGPLVRTWITVALLVAALLGAVGALAAPWVVRVALPGFPAAQAPLATRLFQITLIGLLLQGISQILGSIQNARHRFFVPAAAGALYLGANFAALLLLWRPLGAVSIAVGTLLGGALSAGWLLGLEVHRYGYAVGPDRVCWKVGSCAGALLRLADLLAGRGLPGLCRASNHLLYDVHRVRPRDNAVYAGSHLCRPRRVGQSS